MWLYLCHLLETRSRHYVRLKFSLLVCQGTHGLWDVGYGRKVSAFGETVLITSQDDVDVTVLRMLKEVVVERVQLSNTEQIVDVPMSQAVPQVVGQRVADFVRFILCFKSVPTSGSVRFVGWASPARHFQAETVEKRLVFRKCVLVSQCRCSGLRRLQRLR